MQLKQNAMPADWSPAKRRHKDLEPTWAQKHAKSHHGYKLSFNVNKRHKLIRKIETGTAATHDGQDFETVLNASNTSRDVHADTGYPSAEREAQLKEAGCRLS